MNEDQIEGMMIDLAIHHQILKDLDELRVGCSDDELGAVCGRNVAAFVKRYRRVLARGLLQKAGADCPDGDEDYQTAIAEEYYAQGTEAQRAETVQQGSVHDGPVAKPCAQPPSGKSL